MMINIETSETEYNNYINYIHENVLNTNIDTMSALNGETNITIIPFKVGDKVYHLEHNVYSLRKASIIEYEIISIEIHKNSTPMIHCKTPEKNKMNASRWFAFTDIGNRLFFSSEDAKDYYRINIRKRDR